MDLPGVGAVVRGPTLHGVQVRRRLTLHPTRVAALASPGAGGCARGAHHRGASISPRHGVGVHVKKTVTTLDLDYFA